MAKQPVDWLAIQARYLKGEMPKDIGADYGLTAKQVSAKAEREEWTGKKRELKGNIAPAIQDTTTELCQATDRVILKLLSKVEQAIDEVDNIYLFDGERVNGLLQTALNNATKIRVAVSKQAEPHSDGPARGFVKVNNYDSDRI